MMWATQATTSSTASEMCWVFSKIVSVPLEPNLHHTHLSCVAKIVVTGFMELGQLAPACEHIYISPRG